MIREKSVDLADLVVGKILNLYIASSVWCESIGYGQIQGFVCFSMIGYLRWKRSYFMASRNR